MLVNWVVLLRIVPVWAVWNQEVQILHTEDLYWIVFEKIELQTWYE